MKRLKHVGLVLGGLALFGSVLSPALASLPDVHTALGEPFSIKATGECAACATELSSAGGAVLTGRGVVLTLIWTALSPLGPAVAWFLGVVKGAKKCKAGGDSAGNVLLLGEVHLVFVGLSPLTVAMLLLVPKTKIECEGLNVTIEGAVLGTYNGMLNSQITSFKGALLGAKGKQALTKYLNEAGTAELEAVLLSEAGAGFTKAAENISEELQFKSNTMMEVFG